GSQWSISKSSGTVIAYNNSLEDSNAIGGATFQAIDSTDVNNNSGWTFTNTDNSIRSAIIRGSTNDSTDGSLTFLHNTGDDTDLTTYTFPSQNLGVADADRYIIVGAVARKAG